MQLNTMLYIVPDLMNLFVPGFIFTKLLSWLNNRKFETSTTILCSLVVSYLTQILFRWIHLILFKTVNFDEYVKTTIYILFCIFFALVCAKLKNSKFVLKFIRYFHGKSINSNVMDDLVDYSNGTKARVYIKNTDICYLGQICYVEEKGSDSYISLIHYVVGLVDNHSKPYKLTKLYDLKRDIGVNTIAIFSLRDIDRIELIYEDNSKVWKRFNNY